MKKKIKGIKIYLILPNAPKKNLLNYNQHNNNLVQDQIGLLKVIGHPSRIHLNYT